MAGIDLFIMLDDREVPVEVDPSATVGDVVDALKEALSHEGVTAIGMLKWQGENLADNDKTLADLGICPGSRIVFESFDPATIGFVDPEEKDRFGVGRFEVPRFAGGSADDKVFANVAAAKARSAGGDQRCFVLGPKKPEGCSAWQWRARQFLTRELNAKVDEGVEGFGPEFKVEQSDVSMNLYTGVMTSGMCEHRRTKSGLYDCREADAKCKMWIAVNDVCWTNDTSCSDPRQNLGSSMKEGREIIFTYTKEGEEGCLSLKLIKDDGDTIEEKVYKNVPPELRFFCQIDRHGAGVALTYCGPPRD